MLPNKRNQKPNDEGDIEKILIGSGDINSKLNAEIKNYGGNIEQYRIRLRKYICPSKAILKTSPEDLAAKKETRRNTHWTETDKLTFSLFEIIMLEGLEEELTRREGSETSS